MGQDLRVRTMGEQAGGSARVVKVGVSDDEQLDLLRPQLPLGERSEQLVGGAGGVVLDKGGPAFLHPQISRGKLWVEILAINGHRICHNRTIDQSEKETNMIARSSIFLCLLFFFCACTRAPLKKREQAMRPVSTPRLMTDDV